MQPRVSGAGSATDSVSPPLNKKRCQLGGLSHSPRAVSLIVAPDDPSAWNSREQVRDRRAASARSYRVVGRVHCREEHANRERPLPHPQTALGLDPSTRQPRAHPKHPVGLRPCGLEVQASRVGMHEAEHRGPRNRRVRRDRSDERLNLLRTPCECPGRSGYRRRRYRSAPDKAPERGGDETRAEKTQPGTWSHDRNDTSSGVIASPMLARPDSCRQPSYRSSKNCATSSFPIRRAKTSGVWPLATLPSATSSLAQSAIRPASVACVARSAPGQSATLGGHGASVPLRPGAATLGSWAMDADAVEIRVLGCLIEKQRVTPDQYPLSLNSLRLAANQATNREPVVEYDQATIRAALDRLGRKGWTRLTSGPSSRSAKFRHLLDEALQLTQPQLALLAVLMLRGPQTAGELRTRSERLFSFRSARRGPIRSRRARHARVGGAVAEATRRAGGALESPSRRRNPELRGAGRG